MESRCICSGFACGVVFGRGRLRCSDNQSIASGQAAKKIVGSGLFKSILAHAIHHQASAGLPHSSHTAITVSSQFGGKPEPQKLGYLTLGAVGSLMGRKYESPSKIAPSMRRAVPIILTLVCLRKASHDHSSRVLRK
jgi:hypothetical protein